MNKIIKIGDTKTKVRIFHCKKNICYFIKNILNIKLNSNQEKILKITEKKLNNKKQYDNNKSFYK